MNCKGFESPHHVTPISSFYRDKIFSSENFCQHFIADLGSLCRYLILSAPPASVRCVDLNALKPTTNKKTPPS